MLIYKHPELTKCDLDTTMNLFKIAALLPIELTRTVYFTILAIILVMPGVLPNISKNAYGAYVKAEPLSKGPIINDPSLKTELVAKGLNFPTGMAFLGPNDILVLEKNEGTVRRVIDGKIISKPLLQANVGKQVEWGMLGIAVEKQNDNTFVFLRYTESDEGGDSSSSSSQNSQSMRNRLYRYELVDNKLINPKLLLDLPATSPDPKGENNHDGGKILIGPGDKNIYTAIGDVGGHEGQAQNVKDGDPLDGTSGILRVDQNGQPPSDNPFVGVQKGEENGLNGQQPMSDYYYAYGIRNSFGMDFDPVTGKLWDTENGPTYGDEINLVEPGFNSGWMKVMGLSKSSGDSSDNGGDSNSNHDSNVGNDNGNNNNNNNGLPHGLVTFNGKGIYRDPEFVWKQPIGPTVLKFLNSDKLGTQYQNTIFVGDVDTGSLYNFKLNPQRTALLLDGELADKVADNADELSSVIFGKGFGVITDIQISPDDGYMYILNYAGTIYRIVTSSSSSSS
jgi:aldose sugar dehydrogenase